MAVQTPIVLISGRPQRLAAVDTLATATAATGDNSTQLATTAFVQAAMPADVVPLLMVQTAVTSTTTTAATATLIDATNYLWTGLYVPTGKSVYLEILASATAGSPTVILTALGSTTAVVTLAGTASTTTVRTRSVALTALVSGTEYQVRLFNSVTGTASLKVARIIII